MTKIENGGRIRILPPLLAQKIAAGEVIDRPQSVVRELIDNALDSGATEIELHLWDGGNSSLVVQDNGVGMDREDLAMCWLSHATSKLHEEADLQSISTMGFRGEALSSIATVSRMKIMSATETEGASLEVQGGTRIELASWAGRRGTRVEVNDLFFNLPARLQFLKRGGSEFLLCKTTFIEKALAHPGISFRLFNEAKLALFLPRLEGEKALSRRFFDVYQNQLLSNQFLHQISASYPEGTLTMVLGKPELFQHDRKLAQVYINRRRVNEYSLIQAIEAGYTGFLPGGRFPVAALFMELDPSRVDVNIHPAKREVKLMDGRRLHALVVRMIQDFLRIDFHSRPEATRLPGGFTPTDSPAPRYSQMFPEYAAVSVMEKAPAYDLKTKFVLSELESGDGNLPQYRSGDFHYLGQVFGVFLLVNRGDELIMLDFHAAHERILFDRYRSDQSQQGLLVPVALHADEPGALDQRMRQCAEALAQRGITVSKPHGSWLVEAVPLVYSGNTDLLIEALESDGLQLENLDRCLFATLACRAARKDGDILSRDQAVALIQEALALPEPRCPHGRPIWFTLTKQELYELVGRKV